MVLRSAPHTHPDEAALNRLMDRYAAGESAVFPLLHAQLGPRVRRFLLRMSGDEPLADELAQETFLRIHAARGAYASGAAALPWVYSIARNLFHDALRRRSVQHRHLAAEAGGSARADQPDASSRQPDQRAEARQTLSTVWRALERLPVQQREAFVLLRFEGLSLRDAAEALGTTESSVKSRAFRAYEAIRAATNVELNRG